MNIVFHISLLHYIFTLVVPGNVSLIIFLLCILYKKSIPFTTREMFGTVNPSQISSLVLEVSAGTRSTLVEGVSE